MCIKINHVSFDILFLRPRYVLFRNDEMYNMQQILTLHPMFNKCWDYLLSSAADEGGNNYQWSQLHRRYASDEESVILRNIWSGNTIWEAWDILKVCLSHIIRCSTTSIVSLNRSSPPQNSHFDLWVIKVRYHCSRRNPEIRWTKIILFLGLNPQLV